MIKDGLSISALFQNLPILVSPHHLGSIVRLVYSIDIVQHVAHHVVFFIYRLFLVLVVVN